MRIGQSVLSNLLRYVFSWSFAMSTLALLISLLLSCTTEIGITVPGGMDVLYLYWVAHWHGFNLVSIIIATYGSVSFCNDWNSRFTRLITLRTSVNTYAISQSISCIAIGILPVVAGELLFVIVLRAGHPLCNPLDPTLISRAELPTYGILLARGHYSLYLAFYILIAACRAGFFSAVGLMISAKYNNIFLTLASPLIVYYTLTGFLVAPWMPIYLNFYAILEGLCFSNPTGSVLYTVAICGLLCTIMSLYSTKKITWRLCNE